MSALFVHEYGMADGAPVLALHGVSAHGRRYVPMAAAAFPDARVVAPDLRGHGRSPASPSGRPVTIEDHVADLVAVLDDRGIDQAHLVGHSFGGCLAVHLLAAVPDRVRSVVLLDPAMALPLAKAQSLAEMMVSFDRPEPTLDALVAAKAAGRTPAAIAHSDADVRVCAESGPDGWQIPWDREIVTQAWNEMARPMPAIPTIRPTLLLDAAQAGFVTDHQRMHLSNALGDALTVEQFDLGHMLFWEDFDAVCSSIRSFLSVHTDGHTAGVSAS